jgi:hypothetical protein
MRAQRREIQISQNSKKCKKNLIFSVKKFTFSSFYMELEVFFTIVQQTYSKTFYKFYKSSCGYATHFFNIVSIFNNNTY